MITAKGVASKVYSPAVFQELLDQLFEAAHRHDAIRTSNPVATDGRSGDVLIVNDGTNVRLAVKVSSTWYITANLTAI